MAQEILDNAVASIEIGIEDFESDDDRRVLSAVRNVFAGVLLLCKHVLYINSPTGTDGALAFQRLVPKRTPNGDIQFVRSGRKTVDVAEIETRMKSLGFTLDWTKLNAIAEVRNEIEHFHPSKPKTLVREALADAMPLITVLVRDHMGMKPVQVFSSDCWDSLLDIEKLFSAERKRCVDSLAGVEWKSPVLAGAVDEMRCYACQSSLVMQTDTTNVEVSNLELQCAACGADLDFEDVLEAALDRATAADAYIAATDGGTPPIESCPECDRDFLRH